MPDHPTITVVIARFDDLLALGLRAVLDGDPSVTILAEHVAYKHLAGVLRAHRPAVLILDAAGLQDLAEVRRISIGHPGSRIVVLGDGLSATESAQLLAFGASACLDRSTQARDVRNAIHLASRGMQLTPIGGDGGAQVSDPRLTAREGDVLVLLRDGCSNAQIALTLQIGVETVRTHARSIYRKLGVASRRALVALPPPGAASPAAPHTGPDGARRRPVAPSRLRSRTHP